MTRDELEEKLHDINDGYAYYQLGESNLIAIILEEFDRLRNLIKEAEVTTDYDGEHCLYCGSTQMEPRDHVYYEPIHKDNCRAFTRTGEVSKMTYPLDEWDVYIGPKPAVAYAELDYDDYDSEQLPFHCSKCGAELQDHWLPCPECGK